MHKYTEKAPCEDRGRDWSEIPTIQEMQKKASYFQKLEDTQDRFCHKAPKGTNPDDALISDFQTEEL